MEIQKNISLARHTTFGVGGPARFFAYIHTKAELQEVFNFIALQQIPYYFLGGGSNVLAADKGYAGIVLKLCNKGYDISGERVTVQAGTSLAFFVKEMAQQGLSGLEWGFGIPGTVGGAVRGNAGAFGGNMAGVVEKVEVYDPKLNSFYVLTLPELEYEYRKSIFHTRTSLCIFEVGVHMRKANPQESLRLVSKFSEEKKAKQPLGFKCAGSVFRNTDLSGLLPSCEMPVDFLKNNQVPAGYLIDKKLNLNGHCLGGAAISLKHGNFIVNTGGATSDDIKSLIQLTKSLVKEQTGLTLQEEIQYIGNKS